jgi:hypothetical protein
VLDPVAERVRLFYLCLGALGTNSDEVLVQVRFGAQAPIYTINLVPGAIWARNIGAGKFYQQGELTEPLNLALSPGGMTVAWSAEYFFMP